MHEASQSLFGMIRSANATCGNQLAYGQSTHLLYSEPTKYYSMRSLEKYFISFPANILLFNIGLHLDDPGDMWSILDTMEPIFEQLEKEKNVTIAWTSFTKGHWGCETATTPLENTSTYIIPPDSPPFAHGTGGLPYQWGDIPEMNKMAIEIMGWHNRTSINLEPLLNLRPESHMQRYNDGTGKHPYDCLHMCQPGQLIVNCKL